MVHAAEVLERLARDVRIVIKNFSLSPTDNLHSILGDGADWKPEPGSLSEVAHFSELIAERRAALRFSELGGLDGTWRAIKLIDRLRARFFHCPSSAKGRAASGSTPRITFPVKPGSSSTASPPTKISSR